MKSTTVLPYYPPTPLDRIDHIIMRLWDRHLEIELSKTGTPEEIEQHLDVTAAIIDFWEEKLTEINSYEIQQRRSNRDYNP